MSPNAFRPHLLVLPEDDANRQLANGFALEVKNDRQIQVLPEAGGWSHVVNNFRKNHQDAMRLCPDRRLVLLLDFDGDGSRRSNIEARIPADLQDRVFLLGVRSEPEDLVRAGLGLFDDIGRRLGAECRDGRREIWRHELLQDNAAELARLVASVRSFLFD